MDAESKTDAQPVKKAETRPDPKVLHRLGVDVLIRFHIVYKIARIYAVNNEMFQEQARLLQHAIEAAVTSEGEADLRIRQNSLFFNGVRLKFVIATYPIFKSILEEFRRREIGSLGFAKGLTLDELIGFMSVLAKKDKKSPASFEELAEEVQAAGLPHIRLEKGLPQELAANVDKNTAKIYFLSILHLKEAFERDQRHEKIKINTTRRLMQTLFNHIVDNEAFVHGLTNIKNYDEYTLNHSVNVCMLSIALGRRLGLNRGELVELGIAAFFHDLGKLETPLDILNKPAKLSDEERVIMEKHPHQGAEKLIHLREFRRLPLRSIHVALEHHIKEDFSGYPHYYKKESINLFSKIVKISDYFDAITTPRVYRKKAFTRAEAISLMMEHSGTEFHPAILKAFATMMGTYPVGTMVALSTGEIGVVFEVNPDSRYILRPQVKIIADADGNKLDGEVVDLTERDDASGRFKRTIVKPLAPDKYEVNVTDYFLARAQ